jgi:hypothetical protein
VEMLCHGAIASDNASIDYAALRLLLIGRNTPCGNHYHWWVGLRLDWRARASWGYPGQGKHLIPESFSHMKGFQNEPCAMHESHVCTAGSTV